MAKNLLLPGGSFPLTSLIEADVEGYERELLLGARENIRRYRPRLSICTYHLPNDWLRRRCGLMEDRKTRLRVGIYCPFQGQVPKQPQKDCFGKRKNATLAVTKQRLRGAPSFVIARIESDEAISRDCFGRRNCEARNDWMERKNEACSTCKEGNNRACSGWKGGKRGLQWFKDRKRPPGKKMVEGAVSRVKDAIISPES